MDNIKKITPATSRIVNGTPGYKIGSQYFVGGIGGNFIPASVQGTTAEAGDVVSGKYFYTVQGIKTQGTIASAQQPAPVLTSSIDAGQINVSAAYTPVSGYTSNTSQKTVSSVITDSNLIADNIVSGVTIFGVLGTHPQGSGTEDFYKCVSYTPSAGSTGGTWVGHKASITLQGITYDTTTEHDLTYTDNTPVVSSIYNAGVTKRLIESTVTPDNIKSGVQILGVSGQLQPRGSAVTQPQPTLTTSVNAGQINISTFYTPVQGYTSDTTQQIVTSTVSDDQLTPQHVASGITIFGVLGTLQGGIAQDYYRCQSYTPSAEGTGGTWIGNKAVITSTGITYQQASQNLTYTVNTPVVGGVYTSDTSKRILQQAIVSGNIKSGVSIFGVSGILEQGQEITPGYFTNTSGAITFTAASGGVEQAVVSVYLPDTGMDAPQYPGYGAAAPYGYQVYAGGRLQRTASAPDFNKAPIWHVFSGGTCNSKQLGNKQELYVSAGVEVSSISAGGSTYNKQWYDHTSQADLGNVHVMYHGTATSPNIKVGGKLTVGYGGAAYSATISGNQVAASQGSWGSITYAHGYAYMQVQSGGTANNVVLSNYSQLQVQPGGTATNISGTCGSGFPIQMSVVVAQSTTMNGTVSGHSFSVQDGVLSGCEVPLSITVCSGGTASQITLSSGGIVYVDQGGTAFNVILAASQVDSHAVAVGRCRITSGGYVSGIAMQNIYNTLGVLNGGTAVDVSWNPGQGDITVQPDATISYRQPYATGVWWRPSGSNSAYSSATISGTTITSESVYVLSGGTAEAVTLHNADMQIINGGSATGLILGNCVSSSAGSFGEAHASVFSGGNLNGVQILDGAVSVWSGGTAENIYICGGKYYNSQGAYQGSYEGTLHQYAGGTVRNVSGYFGRHIIHSGVSMDSSPNYSSGMSFVIGSGAVVNSLSLLPDNNVVLYAGCSVSNLGFSGGNAVIRYNIPNTGGILHDLTISGGTVVLAGSGYVRQAVQQGVPILSKVTLTDGAVLKFNANNTTWHQGIIDSITIGSGCVLDMNMYCGSATNVRNSGSIRVLGLGAVYHDSAAEYLSGVNADESSFLVSGSVASNVHGDLEIVSGGTATNTLHGSGKVSYGGIDISGVIPAGASLLVYNGGSAYKTCVSGGVLSCAFGGVISNCTVSSGLLSAPYSACISGASVCSGASAIIQYGSAYDIQCQNASVTVSRTYVQALTGKGGYLSARGCSAGNITWNRGFVQMSACSVTYLGLTGVVSAAVTSTTISSIQLTSGATISLAGVSAYSVPIPYGAQVSIDKTKYTTPNVLSGIVQNGGALTSMGSSYVKDTIQCVSNSFSSLTVSSGHTTTVHDNTTATSLTVAAGGMLYLLGGDVYNTTVQNGGTLEAAGGSLVSTTINGTLSGWAVQGRDLIVGSGGSVYLNSDYARVHGLQLSSGAFCQVTSHAVIWDLVWHPFGGATLVVTNGAHVYLSQAVSGVYIGSNGQLTSSATQVSGATLSGQDISAYVMYNGKLTDATVTEDATVYVYSGGTAAAVNLTSNGSICVQQSGLLTTATVLQNGALQINGTGTSVTVSQGGHVTLIGGSCQQASVSSGGTLMASDGTLSKVTVYQGGYLSGSATQMLQITQSGGFVSDENVKKATYQRAVVESISITGSATLHSGTTFTTASITAGGQMHLYSGGVAGTVDMQSGTIHVYSGASISNIAVSSGCQLLISKGGTATSVTALSGGSVYVYQGATLTHPVFSGGDVHILTGCAVREVVVGSGQYLLVPAQTTWSVLESGGYVDTQDGSVVSFQHVQLSDVQVSSGQSMTVHSNTAVSGLTISSGGSVRAYNNACMSSVTLLDGAHLDIQEKAAVSITSLTAQTGANTVIPGTGHITDITVLSGATLTLGKVSTKPGSDYVACYSATVSSGGTLVIGSNVAVKYITNSGTLVVSKGGSACLVDWTPFATQVIVSNGGYATYTEAFTGVFIGSQGTLLSSATTVSNMNLTDSMMVLPGGTATNIVVQSGGRLQDKGGLVQTVQVKEGGTFEAQPRSKSVLDSIRVLSGAYCSLNGYSEILYAQVNSDASLVVDPVGSITGSCYIRSLSVASGGYLMVGAAAPYGVTVISGVNNGTIYATSAAKIFHITQNAGIITGDTSSASYEQITVSGGVFVVQPGNHAMVTSMTGGSMYISSGGTATTIYGEAWNCLVYQEAGASVTGFNKQGWHGAYLVSSGALVSTGSSFSGTTISSGYQMHVYKSSVVSSPVVSTGGKLYVVWNGPYHSEQGSALSVANNGGQVHLRAHRDVINGLTPLTFASSAFSGLYVQLDGYYVVESGCTAINPYIRGGMRVTTATATISNAVSNAVIEGGSLTISYGASAVSTTIGSGIHGLGSMIIKLGGSADYVSFASGGVLSVGSGGTATNVTWTPCGANIIVETGATVTYTQNTFSGAYYGKKAGPIYSSATLISDKSLYVIDDKTDNPPILYVFSGGTASNNKVWANGYIEVHSGGTAISTLVSTYWYCSNQGTMIVSSGGTALNTTVDGNSGYFHQPGHKWMSATHGSLQLKSGCSVSGLVLKQNVPVEVPPGANVDLVTVSGGTLTINENASAAHVHAFYGSVIAESSAQINGAVLARYATLTLSTGAVCSGLVMSGGTLCVKSGATATDVDRFPGVGTVQSDAGATVTFLNTYSGVFLIKDGSIQSSAMSMDSCAVSQGQTLTIISGGQVTSGTARGPYGTIAVQSSGMLAAATVGRSGLLCVTNSGYVGSAQIQSEGSTTLTDGGIISACKMTGFVHSQYITISKGGTISSLTVGSNVDISIGSGAVVSNLTIEEGIYCAPGASMYVSSGATVHVASWFPGLGYLDIEAGATVTYADGVNTGCYISYRRRDYRTQGLVQSFTTSHITSGQLSGWRCPQYLVNGGYNLYAGDLSIYVMSGATACHIHLGDDGEMFVESGGYASHIYDWLHCSMTIMSGASADCCYVSTYVQAGGTAFNVSANCINYGFVSKAYCNSMYIYSGGTTYDVKVRSRLTVYSGACVSDVTILSGCTMTVSSGGTALDIHNDGGCLSISSGAICSFQPSIIESQHVLGSTLTLYSGTTANTVVVGSNGHLQIHDGGSALCVSTTDLSNMKVFGSGALASNVTMFEISYASVGNYGCIQSITVQNGGYLHIENGGLVSGATISSGGHVYVSSGGTLMAYTAKTDSSVHIYQGAVVL